MHAIHLIALKQTIRFFWLSRSQERKPNYFHGLIIKRRLFTSEFASSRIAQIRVHLILLPFVSDVVSAGGFNKGNFVTFGDRHAIQVVYASRSVIPICAVWSNLFNISTICLQSPRASCQRIHSNAGKLGPKEIVIDDSV